MKCPYLGGTYFQWCKASKETYIPSRFEFDEYCTHSGYKICSTYSRAVSDGTLSVADRDKKMVANGS